jgi:hypothetical protein
LAKVELKYLIVGLTGGLQPDKMQRCFGGSDDGLYTRLLFGWPIEPELKTLRRDGNEFDPDFVSALSRLNGLTDKDDDGNFISVKVPLSRDALEKFEEFRATIHSGRAALDGREREWWAKGPGVVLRLAGTLAFMDWAMTDLVINSMETKMRLEPSEISVGSMQAAVTLWLEYFWPHAKAALRQIGGRENHTLERRTLRWVRAHRAKEKSVSLQDIRRHALGQCLDEEKTQEMLRDLVRRGWLVRKVSQPKGGIGRAVVRWAVNPILWTTTDRG